jgi:hypothetical protein
MDKISLEDVIGLRKSTNNWKEISMKLGISKESLRRWRKTTDYDNKYEPLVTHQELVAKLSKHWTENVLRGDVETLSFARSFIGRSITRSQVRAALRAINPAGPTIRSGVIKVRGVFKAPRPGYVYCADTNHKGRRWGFVFGEIVDACTRACLTSWVACHNRSLRAFEEYVRVMEITGVPEFLRVDDGTECKGMIKAQVFFRGEGRYWIGSSHDNVRVESHHGRVTLKVTSLYFSFFARYESTWFNTYDPLHKFVLWHVFSHRMQQDLDQYSVVWNNHKIRTIRTSPSKLFHDLVHRRQRLPQDANTRDFMKAMREQYAFDERGMNPLTDAEYAELRVRAPPLTLNDNTFVFDDRVFLALEVLSEIFDRRD